MYDGYTHDLVYLSNAGCVWSIQGGIVCRRYGWRVRFTCTCRWHRHLLVAHHHLLTWWLMRPLVKTENGETQTPPQRVCKLQTLPTGANINRIPYVTRHDLWPGDAVCKTRTASVARCRVSDDTSLYVWIILKYDFWCFFWQRQRKDSLYYL